VSRLTPRRFRNYLCRRLRLHAYLRQPGDGRRAPQIPAHVLLWALLLGQFLREVSYAGLEALVRSPARRALAVPRRAEGPAAVRWDGRDTAGRAVPAGTYFLHLAGSEMSGKVVRSR